MMEVKMWILTVVCVVLWDILKSLFSKRESRTENLLKQILDQLSETNERMAAYDEKFVSLTKQNNTVDERLNDHSKRIRDLEKEQHKCKNFEKIG